MSNSDPKARRPRAKRYLTLAVGTLALGAVGAAGANVLAPTAPAFAQNLSAKGSPVEAPGFADIVERVSPAVVSIRVKTESNPQLSSFGNFGDNSPFERFFRQFEDQLPGLQMPQRKAPDQRGGHGHGFFIEGQGSGFFISPDGYVVTNDHVVNHASEVLVVTKSGEILNAKVVGVDDKTDLALVKVEANGREFPYVTFDQTPVRVGDWVVAVGNPFGLGGTVTAGIVSALGREIGAGPYDDFIQIDAPINRGNSGGPTFDLQGKVVGVNTAIYSPSGGSVGIGFAIPASIAEPVIEDLKDNGKVTRGWLGVQIQEITPDIADSIGLDHVKGALVTAPQADSPAAKADIREGDAIVAVNGNKVDGARDLARMISSEAPGTKVELTIWRDGKEHKIEVTLGRLKETQQASAEPQTAPGSDTRFGMTVAPAPELGINEEGLAVVELDPSSVAAEKGLSVGDVILSAGGEPVHSFSDFAHTLEVAKSEGREHVLLKVQTGENVRFVALPLNKA